MQNEFQDLEANQEKDVDEVRSNASNLFSMINQNFERVP
jgi:hypothetical protein